MATIGALALTYADWAKRLDPDGQIDKIVEVLAETNEILDDMLVVEGNLPTGHRTTIRTGIPQATWRMLNYGVPNGKSTTVQVTDSCGMLETYSEIDKALADLNGNTAQFRMSEDRAFIEGMNQQMAGTVFYGNSTANPERFTGLAPRFNDLTNAESKDSIVDAGGATNTNTSIWLVVWGENTVHGIFPKGSKAGLQMNDLGEHTLFDANNNKYQGYRSHYKWDAGLTVRDWRYAVRIANIDVASLRSGDVATLKDLVTKMIDAEERVPNLNAGKAAFYCNRLIRASLRKGILEKVSNNLTSETVTGKVVTSFDGIPVRRVDQILNTEAQVL